MLAVQRVQGNFQSPLIGAIGPIHFSWAITSDGRDVYQQSYQLQVAEYEDFSTVAYDSGMVSSEQSIGIHVHGFTFQEGRQYWVRVKVVTTDGRCSPFSEPLHIITAFTSRNWTAQFVAVDSKKETSEARYLRKDVHLSRVPIRAMAYTSALGLYEFSINGEVIGDDLFTPGWSDYKKRVLYQSRDITAYLQKGSNCLGALVGVGWYAGEIGFECNRNFYGDRTAFFCQIDLEYADGTIEQLGTDGTWRWAESPILFSEIYDGETYDANREATGWNQPGYRDDSWKSVQELPGMSDRLEPYDGMTVGVVQELAAVQHIVTPHGEHVIDFGQNLTGWVKFKVQGMKGEEVVIRHAEVLDADGNFYTENLRSAKQTIRYTLKGGPQETFHPHFSFQGFRYICLDVYPGTIELENFTAQVIHSRFDEIGGFSSSNALLNRLQHNIIWSLKGNFLDIPTDCPQRDERLGWTGDAQMFVPTAAFLADTWAFFSKWLRDLVLEQRSDGAVSNVVPNVIMDQGMIDGVVGDTFGSSAWGDAATIVPWTMYLAYGDSAILERQYESMKGWVEFIRGNATDGLIWEKSFSFGDWVALDAQEGSYLGATPVGLVSTAYYVRSTQILAQSAKILGKTADANLYADLAEKIKEAFRSRFIGSEGKPKARTQTACVLSLVFNLLLEWQKEPTVELLSTLIKENDGHLTTGFVGTPFICQALGEHGRLSEAYDLLLKQDYPSWLYQVERGATTIWEHWDGIKPDGSMWSPDMNSFNHYAYGAVGSWLYTSIAGLRIDEEYPGYKKVIVAPHIGGGLTTAEAFHHSPYGKIATSWKIIDRVVEFYLSIPPNTSAHLVLEGSDLLDGDFDLSVFTRTDSAFMAEIGSGEYHLRYIR